MKILLFVILCVTIFMVVFIFVQIISQFKKMINIQFDIKGAYRLVKEKRKKPNFDIKSILKKNKK